MADSRKKEAVTSLFINQNLYSVYSAAFTHVICGFAPSYQ